jgi:hypothetical protein
MSKAPNSKQQRRGRPRAPAGLNIGISDFEIVSNFELGISDFSAFIIQADG